MGTERPLEEVHEGLAARERGAGEAGAGGAIVGGDEGDCGGLSQQVVSCPQPSISRVCSTNPFLRQTGRCTAFATSELSPLETKERPTKSSTACCIGFIGKDPAVEEISRQKMTATAVVPVAY